MTTQSAPAAITNWFTRRDWMPFPFQHEVWDAYCAGESGLIHAATGTGKTYAAWMGPLIEWMQEHGPTTSEIDQSKQKRRSRDSDAVSLRVLWITPLRALAADTESALRAPLVDLALPWTLETRTGDTTAAVRARQRRRLPSALITTPESLSLLLTRADAADQFRDLRLIVVDEWHELLGTKRGVQTELALARLRHWQPAVRTWGLSATLGNLDVALAGLLGTPQSPSAQPGRLVRGVMPKAVRIDSLLPDTVERFPWAGHLGLKLLPQVVSAIEEGATTLVFTNTRAQTEIWYQALLDARPDWAGQIALHHGSLDRQVREWVEEGLRHGKLRCVVCTSSLDLGVDFTPVDRVIQIGSPKGVARLLQRAGRSGHQPGAESRVTCVPTHAFELVEVAAARAAAETEAIEARPVIECPLDVLVQHVVTMALGGGFRADALFAEIRTAYTYRNLTDTAWSWVIDFVTRGGPALTAYPEYCRVAEQDGWYTVPDEAVARRHRMSIGTIMSDAALNVQYLRGEKLGTVEEGFIASLRPGDRFTFAGRVLEFVRVRDMTAWVRKATSAAGAVPRWTGGRMPLSTELAAAVRDKLNEARAGIFQEPEMAAVQSILHLQARWSKIPAADELLIERVQTREGHHLFFYPFAGRLVHTGMAALLAYRISRLGPISFTLVANDYGFELLSPDPAPLEAALAADLLSPQQLGQDIPASLNAAELAQRQFREIARVAGLVFPGYPGNGKSMKQFQASSSLFYDVFTRYDPHNLLLYQAESEVLERQLEQSRLGRALERIAVGTVTICDVKRPTPLAFPLLVDRLGEQLSSEKLADRVRRMQIALEKAAG